MALALRPAVLLIALASLLFILAGWLDSASGFEGCRAAPASAPCEAIAISSIESWTFGAANVLVAVLIARGNERVLALRIGLAAFFMVERPVTAVALGPKPIESIALHMTTAIVEAVILVSTTRLWRLGHSVSETDLAFLTLPSTGAPLPVTAGASVASRSSGAAARMRSAGLGARAAAAKRFAKVAALVRRAGWRKGSHP